MYTVCVKNGARYSFLIGNLLGDPRHITYLFQAGLEAVSKLILALFCVILAPGNSVKTIFFDKKEAELTHRR